MNTRRCAAFITLAFAVSLYGQALTSSDLTVTNEWVNAEGHWAKRNSTVVIECYRRAGFCIESRAWLEPTTNHVLLRTFNYLISRWSRDGIAAHEDGPVSGLITFGTKTVSLVTHEKGWGDDTDHLEHGHTDTLHK